MRYSLFVDESGNFEDKKKGGDWIVGGMLCPSDIGTAEKRHGNRLNPIPSRYGLDPSELHRTELNNKALSPNSKWCFERISSITESLLDSVTNNEPEAIPLAVVNQGHRGLEDREQTYRMVLLDLIALADSVIPPDEPVEALELRVASRTKDGVRLTDEDEIQETLDRVLDAMEVDLASRGLMGLIDRDNVDICKQSESWLLTVADFWCNSVYNRDHAESGNIVETVLENVQGRLFHTGIRDHRVRRAQVAERNGNFGLALYRWAVLNLEGHLADHQSEAIGRLCRQVLSSGSRRPKATTNSVIEMLWRHYKRKKNYSGFLDSLKKVENALEGMVENISPKCASILFRIRNMMHLAANRCGLTEVAKSIGQSQRTNRSEIVHHPENFSLLLRSQINQINTLQHCLRYSEAEELSENHLERVKMYGELWDLYDEEVSSEEFRTSEMSLRANMTWIKSRVSAAEPDSPLPRVYERLEDLSSFQLNSENRGRLRNYSIATHLRAGWYEKALSRAIEGLKGYPNDIFAQSHAARAAATAFLEDPQAYRHQSQEILDTLQGSVERGAEGVPVGLALRDIALLEKTLNDDLRAARESLQEGRKTLTWDHFSEATTIREWVEWTLDLTGQFLSNGKDLSVPVDNQFRELLRGRQTIESLEDLIYARRVSPY